MDPSGLPAMFQGIETRVGAAASPAVLSMAGTFKTALRRTLSARTRGEHDFRARGERGQPPAMRSGDLRNSVVRSGGAGDPVATASVRPTMFYAGVQEWGHTMHARPHGYMKFQSGGTWWLKEVKVGENPYMRPTIARCIANGSLGRSAAKAFTVAVW